MTKQKSIYRKNFSLIIAFIVLLSAILVIALFITYNLNRKYVTNEFSSRKIEVLEQTIRPYNDFFYNKIPKITAYQGFLNQSSALQYASSVFKNYPFVRSVDFYHFEISNHPDPLAVRTDNLYITVRNAFHFTPAANADRPMKAMATTTPRRHAAPRARERPRVRPVTWPPR